MKKTMLALMATVGLAFGAKAEVLNATGFEDLSTFDVKALEYEGDAKQGLYWAVTNTAADLSQTVVAEYGASATPEKVPAAFVDATTTNKYLKVDTGSDVLYRSVAKAASVDGETGMPLLNEGTEIGDGLYFDANVQFTASDGEPTFDSADKLVVWLKADEENNTTNLMVTAGVYNEGTEKYDPTPFELDGTYFADTWYRLTVKAMVESDVTKFVVYVNDTQVTVGGTAVVFDSLVQTGNAATTLAAVGFQGTGAVDNLVWTTDDPFPAPVVDTVALTIDLTDENFAFAELAANAEVVDVADPAPIVADVDDVITFVAKVADGFTPTVAGYVLQKSAEKDEDECYAYTFTVTVTQEMIENGLTLTITVTENGGGDEPTPVVPGGEAHTTTEEAARAVVVKAPDGSGIESGTADYTTYSSYFTQKVTGSGSDWTTTFELNADGTNAVQTAANTALTTADTGVLAKALTLSSTTAEATAKVTITKGFYWTLATGSALGTWTYPAGTLSTGAEADLTVKKPDLGKGFYKLLISPTPIPAK